MFSTFMAHARNRRQNDSDPETPTFGDDLNSRASTIRRSRRVTPTSGNILVGGSAVGPSSERSPKLGSRGHSQVPSSNSTPTPTPTITVTNPIRRETGSLEYTGTGRRISFGVGSTESKEQDEMKTRSNSRRRRLYPPPNEQTTATSTSPKLYGYERDEPDFTTVYERPHSRADHRPGHILVIDPPPEVVRLDSTGTDNGPELEIQNSVDDSGLPQNHPYSFPEKIADSNTYTPNLYLSRDAPSTQRQSKSPRPQRPPKSQKRQMHPYAQRSTQGSLSNPSLDDGRPIAKSANAVSREYLVPPDQTRSETQSHSEADFYASAVEDFEAETEGSTSDYNSDNNGSAFASVLDSFPLPAHSVTSTTSSSRSGSGLPSAANSAPGAIGVNTMTKNKWGLKLQLQTQGRGVGGTSAGHAVSKGNSTRQQAMSVPIDFPASSSSTVESADMDTSDVHKHQPGYNHPFVHPSLKPLSPIAEQDYMSPSPHSSKDENRSIRFRRGSGSVREKGNALNSSVEKRRSKGDSHADGDDRVSIRRMGSLGSATGVVMSRTGSGSAADGTGIHNKPDPHRPFITRPLNRTISQTSSKSWTESVAGQPTPTATPTHSSAQPSPRTEGLVPSHVQGMGRTITTHLPAMRVGGGNRNGGVEPVHPPNSAGTTPNSMSGTLYSPTSTLLQQSLSNASSQPTAIQPPPGVIVANTPSVPTSHGSSSSSGGEGRAGAIPKLPSIPAFDPRFSMLESVTSRNSRKVDKMPIIPGSIEGHREDEYEEEQGQYERHSLHADSFVTAGEAEAGEGMELESMNEAGEDLFIHRRWERDAGLGSGAPIRSDDCPTFRAKSESAPMSSCTPAFWTFWIGFLFPVLWLVGGWHFTNAGEMPPKYTTWEWFFWNRRWRPKKWFKAMREGLLACFRRRPKRRVRRANSSGSNANARAGKVYPALPRWVAEKQSTDDGRMRLNDPKRSLRGIQFGYPFIPRYGSAHLEPSFERIFTAPNRVLDQLYGVRLREVCGRPETGRRMLDPWIQRCRYAFCYALLLLAVGLCTASVYLIIVNTRNLR